MKIDNQDTLIYSCITGTYDTLHSIPYRDLNGVRCICFSDRLRSVSSVWEILELRSPDRLNNGHDINRFHKIFPYHVLPDCRYSIYLDGNIRYIGDYDNLIEQFRLSGAAIGAFRHPQRRTVSEEVLACRKSEKFDSFDDIRTEKQLIFYADEGFDIDSEITANYMLIRDNKCSNLRFAMSLWWSQIFEFTKRDQISLGYALWKTQTPWVFLDDLNGVKEKDLIRVGHYNSLCSRVRKKAIKIFKKYLVCLNNR